MSILNDPITGKITNDPATGKVLTTPAGGPALCACCGVVFECCIQGDGGDTCNGSKCTECTSIGDGVTPTAFAFTMSGVQDCSGTALPMNVSRFNMCFQAGAGGGGGPDDPGDFTFNCTWKGTMAPSTEIGGSGFAGFSALLGFSASLGWTFLVTESGTGDTIFIESGITWPTCCEVDAQVVTNQITSCGANQVGKNGTAEIWSCSCPWRELEDRCVVDPNFDTCQDVPSSFDACLLEVEIAGTALCPNQTCTTVGTGIFQIVTALNGINGTHTLTRRQTVTGSFGRRDVYLGKIDDGWDDREHTSFADCLFDDTPRCVTSGAICIRVVIENGIWVRQFQVTLAPPDLDVTGSVCSFLSSDCVGGGMRLPSNNCGIVLDIATFFVDSRRLGVAIPTTEDCQCFFAQRHASGTGTLTANFIGY